MKQEKKTIRLLALDMDGTLTDGKLYFTENGELFKAFDVKDGYGILMLQNYKVTIAIITAFRSGVVLCRAKHLGIDLVYQGVADKAEKLREICAQQGIALEETAYMGDDLPDLEAVKLCGFGMCPADAITEIRAAAQYVCRKNGGHGAVREAIEYIMVQGMLIPA